LNKLFLENDRDLENDCDIVKFYSDKHTKQQYPKICYFATAILVFPHDSTEIQRLFSQLKSIKTDNRVNLSVEAFEALLLTRCNKIELNNDQVFNQVSEKHRLIKYEANEESKQRLREEHLK